MARKQTFFDPENPPVDAAGVPFDPDKHQFGPDGYPKKKKDGTWNPRRMAPGRAPGMDKMREMRAQGIEPKKKPIDEHLTDNIDIRARAGYTVTADGKNIEQVRARNARKKAARGSLSLDEEDDDEASTGRVTAEPTVVELFRHQRQLCQAPWVYKDIEFFFLIGGYGCVHGDTLIDTPQGPVKIRDWQGGELYAWSHEFGKVATHGEPAVRHDPTTLFTVTTEHVSVSVTQEHRFLTPGGMYRFLRDLSEGDTVLTSHGPETILSIEDAGVHEYFDVRVPLYENYVTADGGIHHNCGKTSSDVFFILRVVEMYWQHPVKIGVGSTTITLLRKTLISDLERYLIQTGSTYRYDRNANIMEIGKVQFIFVALEQPSLIYAYNFSAFLADELDELPQTKAIEAFTAIQERCRVPFPDGRKPFSVFTTTAQGFRGTYQIIEEMKEKGIGYVLIRGHTKDNTALPRSYVERLYSIYDENERAAFLEGRFVNLTTGRVYPSFTDATLVDDIEILPDDVIHVGQDINTGFSKAVAMVKRGRTIYAVKEWSFKEIATAPKIMRQSFPFNRILWYPDSTGKEIMKGYLEEVRSSDIELRISGTNPSILERVFLVNKSLSTGKYKVCKSCKELIMGYRTRQYNDLGDPEKGRGEKAPDHVCLTGNTLISTNRGLVRIDEVREGDFAITRNGFRRVSAAWCTGVHEAHEYLLPTGGTISGTPEHPVWTMNRGWVALGELTDQDTLSTLDATEYSIWLSSTESSSICKENTTLGKSTEKLSDFTSTCTDKCMGKFPLDSMSIIRTTTPSTILQKILSLWSGPHTTSTTPDSPYSKDQKSFWRTWKKHGTRQQSGTGQRPVEHGTPSIIEKILRRIGLGNLFARSVEHGSQVSSIMVPSAGRDTARRSAYPRTEGSRVLMTLTECVPPVELFSASTNTNPLSVAPGSARPLTRKPLGKTKVYNLTVEGEHRYFANGIEVSNCDGSEYALVRMIQSDRDFFELFELTRTYRQDHRM